MAQTFAILGLVVAFLLTIFGFLADSAAAKRESAGQTGTRVKQQKTA